MSDTEHHSLTYDLQLLESSESKWRRSASLRIVYASLFNAVRERLQPGSTLELGSGIGNMKEFIPRVVTSDLVKTKYVDISCSAYNIPRHPENDPGIGWANIVAIDVLHHLCRPMDFFRSAADALDAGGRIILIEPAATFYGTIFYRLFHTEPINKRALLPPFEFKPDTPAGHFANMAMGVVLFEREKKFVSDQLSNHRIKINEVTYRDFMAYPLSGGYSGPQLAPQWFVRFLMKIENRVPEVLNKWIGLRMIIVLQKA